MAGEIGEFFAAHFIPICSGKMKSGSRMILTTAPRTVEAMADFGLPADQMTGFMACLNIWNGMPSVIQRKYSLAHV